jgi:hypothetical protein
MTFMEIDVDAVSCPTVVFNSVKGRFARPSDRVPRTPYPPRNDLTMFTPRDCDEPTSGSCSMDRISAARFAEINDLDAVAAATPPYGAPFRGAWSIPPELPEGAYALFVEVNKEFDGNAHFTYESPVDPQLADSGLRNNYGQPSVVFRVPFRFERRGTQQAATAEIAGYGDWDGATGALHPPDVKISDAPGSGRGRLAALVEPAVAGGEPLRGKVHVVVESRTSCPSGETAAARVADLEVVPGTIGPTHAEIRFREPPAPAAPVDRYEVRYREGQTMTVEAFREAAPAPSVPPAPPGGARTFRVTGLKPATTYVIGVRGAGCCISSAELATVSFQTAEMKVTQLAGCFVATAAFGSPLGEELDGLRALRDRVLRRGVVGAVGVDLYERAAPPLAALVSASETARALVRALLGPVAAASRYPEK